MYSHRHTILHLPAKFRSNPMIVGGVTTSYPFFRDGKASILDLMRVMLNHPRSAIVGISSVLKFGLHTLYSFEVIAIFIFLLFSLFAYSRPFLGGLGCIIPPNMVTHRSNTQKDHHWAETRRLSHKAWKSVQRFELGTGSRKKGQSKKSQGDGNILTIWGEAPTAPIESEMCMVGHLADVITYGKFQMIFSGVEFPIFLLIFAWALQQCSSTALPVMILKKQQKSM